MDLNIYEIIQGPVISDKAYRLHKKSQKIALRVHPHANKSQVKQALQKLFNVKVHDVNIIVRKGKNKRVGRRDIQGSLMKKAVVTLVSGSSLNFFDQGGAEAFAHAEKNDRALAKNN